jgi:hypothetical protein
VFHGFVYLEAATNSTPPRAFISFVPLGRTKKHIAAPSADHADSSIAAFGCGEGDVLDRAGNQMRCLRAKNYESARDDALPIPER